VPCSYFQVDFVCDLAIDKLGPAGSNIFYHAQDRFISGDNGGCQPFTPGQLHAGDTATIGFWANNNGQALLKSLNGGSTATGMATWLSSNFPNLFPTSLIGTTNQSVAAYYKGIQGVSGTPKLEAQVMAVAFAVYATDYNLAGGSYAALYGLNVRPGGIAADLVSPGSSGSVLNIAASTPVTIMTLLIDADALATNGTLFSGDNVRRGKAITIFSTINSKGDIT
jgi:hypothetical protein